MEKHLCSLAQAASLHLRNLAARRLSTAHTGVQTAACPITALTGVLRAPAPHEIAAAEPAPTRRSTMIQRKAHERESLTHLKA